MKAKFAFVSYFKFLGTVRAFCGQTHFDHKCHSLSLCANCFENEEFELTAAWKQSRQTVSIILLHSDLSSTLKHCFCHLLVDVCRQSSFLLWHCCDLGEDGKREGEDWDTSYSWWEMLFDGECNYSATLLYRHFVQRLLFRQALNHHKNPYNTFNYLIN